jgi:surface antigen
MDSVADNWGEWNRECTSFVAWRLHSRNGFEMPFHDDASGWAADAQSRGYTVDTNPAVGSVAYWTGGNHVAWVEAVHSPTSIDIEEFNLSGDGRYHEELNKSTMGYSLNRRSPGRAYRSLAGDSLAARHNVRSP